MDWGSDLAVGEYLVIDAYRKLDPDTYTDVYDDIWLKRYTTALVKKEDVSLDNLKDEEIASEEQKDSESTNS